MSAQRDNAGRITSETYHLAQSSTGRWHHVTITHTPQNRRLAFAEPTTAACGTTFIPRNVADTLTGPLGGVVGGGEDGGVGVCAGVAASGADAETDDDLDRLIDATTRILVVAGSTEPIARHQVDKLMLRVHAERLAELGRTGRCPG